MFDEKLGDVVNHWRSIEQGIITTLHIEYNLYYPYVRRTVDFTYNKNNSQTAAINSFGNQTTVIYDEVGNAIALTEFGLKKLEFDKAVKKLLIILIVALLFLSISATMHHVSIRTGNIHKAIAFYELLGFNVCDRFTTGYTLACWMEGLQGRIELIQIPQPHPAPDAFNDEHYVGYYHLSFDLTETVPDLTDWLASLQQRFAQASQAQIEQYQPLKILLQPEQQQIGNFVYEVAFIADTDNLPLEFIRKLN